MAKALGASMLVAVLGALGSQVKEGAYWGQRFPSAGTWKLGELCNA